MRFQVREPWKDGDARTRRGFLILPKKIGNEWRWLEWAIWRERLASNPYQYEWIPLWWGGG